MTLGTFDIIAILQRELRDFDVPASTLSKLTGITSGRLSSYLNETVKCPAEHQMQLRESWSQLKKLIEFSKPLPLNFTKSGEISRCIEMMESGSLQVVVIESIGDRR